VIAVSAASTALASPAEIHTIFWQQDTSTRTTVDALFECLTQGSTFGTTWGQQFGLGPITYAGSSVLPTPAPSQVTLGGNLDQIIGDAFTQGLVPAPKPGVHEEYLFYYPPGVTGGDNLGAVLCSAQGPCAEHGTTQVQGHVFDYALVPISCSKCASGLAVDTIGGEHEAAEGLADLAGAQFEVGDGCEDPSQVISLTCCGQTFAIQPLAGAAGKYDCQAITATSSAGSVCSGTPDAGGASSSGGDSGSPAGTDAAAPPGADAGAGSSGGSSSSGSSSGGSSGSSGGVDAGRGGGSSSSSGGSLSADSGAVTGDADGGVNGDAFGSQQAAGCGCVAAGTGQPRGALAGVLGAVAALLVSSRRRVRRGPRLG
jgi:hypothetical protein